MCYNFVFIFFFPSRPPTIHSDLCFFLTFNPLSCYRRHFFTVFHVRVQSIFQCQINSQHVLDGRGSYPCLLKAFLIYDKQICKDGLREPWYERLLPWTILCPRSLWRKSGLMLSLWALSLRAPLPSEQSGWTVWCGSHRRVSLEYLKTEHSTCDSRGDAGVILLRTIYGVKGGKFYI